MTNCLHDKGELSTAETYDHTECAELVELTMSLANAAHIVTAEHSLSYTDDGVATLHVERVDIGTNGEELPMDHFCRIFELSDDERNDGSYEEVLEVVEECSSVNKIDALNLWEQVVFAWICGDSDFNLTRIALYEPYEGICALAPLQYAFPTALLNSSKIGVMALSINNKKRGVTRLDLESAMRKSGLKNRAINLIFKKFTTAQEKWLEIIDNSQINTDLKSQFKSLIQKQIG